MVEKEINFYKVSLVWPSLASSDEQPEPRSSSTGCAERPAIQRSLVLRPWHSSPPRVAVPCSGFRLSLLPVDIYRPPLVPVPASDRWIVGPGSGAQENPREIVRQEPHRMDGKLLSIRAILTRLSRGLILGHCSRGRYQRC